MSRRSTLASDAQAWPNDLIGGALDAALAVARAGAAAEPPREPPEALRPFLQFSRLTGPAAAAARDALDDDEFRAEVVAAGLGGLDVPSVLALVRPARWDETLAQLADLGRVRAESAEAATQRRRLERRLDAAASARARADERATAAEAAAARSRQALADERAGIDQIAARADKAEADLRRLQAEVDELRSALKDERRELDRARRALADVREVEAPSPLDAARVAAELGALDDVVRTLDRRVDSLRDALEPSLRPPADKEVRRPSARRQPVAPPPGLLPDAPDAVAALVRTPGIIVLVDGYNVTIGRQGSTLSVAEQRRWLIDRTSPLAARIDGEIWLVFDGDDVGPVARPGGRQVVRTIFTSRGEEADDRIIGLVGELPVTRAVAVVSDDRRVRTGAGRGGANVVTVDAFLAIC